MTPLSPSPPPIISYPLMGNYRGSPIIPWQFRDKQINNNISTLQTTSFFSHFPLSYFFLPQSWILFYCIFSTEPLLKHCWLIFFKIAYFIQEVNIINPSPQNKVDSSFEVPCSLLNAVYFLIDAGKGAAIIPEKKIYSTVCHSLADILIKHLGISVSVSLILSVLHKLTSNR